MFVQHLRQYVRLNWVNRESHDLRWRCGFSLAHRAVICAFAQLSCWHLMMLKCHQGWVSKIELMATLYGRSGRTPMQTMVSAIFSEWFKCGPNPMLMFRANPNPKPQSIAIILNLILTLTRWTFAHLHLRTSAFYQSARGVNLSLKIACKEGHAGSHCNAVIKTDPICDLEDLKDKMGLPGVWWVPHVGVHLALCLQFLSLQQLLWLVYTMPKVK